VAFRLLLVLLLAFGLVVEVRAQDHVAKSEQVEARLVSELEAAVPGETLRVGLEQKITPGWHTYWQNPGDVGGPTVLSWDLPEGVEAGPIQWPAPKALPYFEFVNYGYKDHVLLVSAIDVPADWPSGEPLPLRVEAEWLVCADICIPESAELSLTLPTASGPPTKHPDHAELFSETEAALPKPSPWPMGYALEEGRFRLLVEGGFEADVIEAAHFFPKSPEIIDHAAEQSYRIGERGLVLETAAKEGAGAALEGGALEGVLVLTEDLPDGALRQAFEVRAEAGAVLPKGDGLAASLAGIGLLEAALLAVLGGIILNLMPCVFPVLSMKALHLVRHAGEPGAGLQGLVYTAGVLTTFTALAGLLIALKATGAAVGWGFQLQSPIVVALLAYLIFALGLWLSGAIELGARLMGLGSGLAQKDGLAGSFFTGVLAVIVASPCTAPFMGTAMGFALTQDVATALTVFLALGLGLALPYLALSLSPALQRLMPRPGPWMERFKQALAFPMFATAAWLVWVLAQQAGDQALLLILLGFVAIALAIWAFRLDGRIARTAGIACLASALGLGLLPGHLPAADPERAAAGYQIGFDGPAEPFTPAYLAALRAEGRPILVNMTAAWCLTCLVNERNALSGAAFEAALARNDAAYLKGDWTRRDPVITDYLRSFDRAGVPLYVLYPATGEPTLLPQLLTEGIVQDALSAAGTRRAL